MQNNNVWDIAKTWRNIREPARPSVSEIKWLSQCKLALEKLFQQFFTIQGTGHGEIFYRNQTYFYLLQKKCN